MKAILAFSVLLMLGSWWSVGKVIDLAHARMAEITATR